MLECNLVSLASVLFLQEPRIELSEETQQVLHCVNAYGMERTAILSLSDQEHYHTEKLFLNPGDNYTHICIFRSFFPFFYKFFDIKDGTVTKIDWDC